MGTSHFGSNVVAKSGSETITGFATISATALKGALTGNVTGNVTGDVTGNVTGDVTGNVTGDVAVSNYIKMGATQYILFGDANVEASVVALATALTATPQGSLYVSTKGALWIYDGATTATRFSIY